MEVWHANTHHCFRGSHCCRIVCRLRAYLDSGSEFQRFIRRSTRGDDDGAWRNPTLAQPIEPAGRAHQWHTRYGGVAGFAAATAARCNYSLAHRVNNDAA